MQVPIRPALSKLALQSDASYLIVGGLKGLCGNLAIHMSQHGARHIIIISRRGLSNEASKKTVMNCLAYGREIGEAKGDVTDVKFLRSVFKEASPGIAGVIRGAMILRVSPNVLQTVLTIADDSNVGQTLLDNDAGGIPRRNLREDQGDLESTSSV